MAREQWGENTRHKSADTKVSAEEGGGCSAAPRAEILSPTTHGEDHDEAAARLQLKEDHDGAKIHLQPGGGSHARVGGCALKKAIAHRQVSME